MRADHRLYSTYINRDVWRLGAESIILAVGGICAASVFGSENVRDFSIGTIHKCDVKIGSAGVLIFAAICICKAQQPAPSLTPKDRQAQIEDMKRRGRVRAAEAEKRKQERIDESFKCAAAGREVERDAFFARLTVVSIGEKRVFANVEPGLCCKEGRFITDPRRGQFSGYIDGLDTIRLLTDQVVDNQKLFPIGAVRSENTRYLLFTVDKARAISDRLK